MVTLASLFLFETLACTENPALHLQFLKASKALQACMDQNMELNMAEGKFPPCEIRGTSIVNSDSL